MAQSETVVQPASAGLKPCTTLTSDGPFDRISEITSNDNKMQSGALALQYLSLKAKQHSRAAFAGNGFMKRLTPEIHYSG
jgi:hypothetical protein